MNSESRSTADSPAHNAPSTGRAALTFGGVLAIMIGGIAAGEIELHLLLIGALIWACANAYSWGYDFHTLKDCMSAGIAKALSALYMFILIGIVIAAFIECGTIPVVIYYALDYVSPGWFLPAGLLFTSFMLAATGTSWGTVGTIGVVLVGLGAVIGIPLPIVAGMVVSGAMFGDKMSPVSDTTILAAACAETDIYAHIRSMACTTGPAYLITLILFAVIGIQYGGTPIGSDEIAGIKDVLSTIFDVNPIALLPIVLLIGLSLRGTPAEPTMIIASLTAIGLAAIIQERAFTDIFNSVQYGYNGSSGSAMIDTLLNRGGIQSMMWTLSLALIALALGGVLDGIGVMRALTERLIRRIKSALQLVATTIATGIVANMSMGENYLTVIFTSQIFKETFQKMGFKPRMLSRTVEEGGTLTAGLIPWTTGGAFFAASLGVATLEYAPWALLSIVNIAVSLTMASLGIAVFRQVDTARDFSESDS